MFPSTHLLLLWLLAGAVELLTAFPTICCATVSSPPADGYGNAGNPAFPVPVICGSNSVGMQSITTSEGATFYTGEALLSECINCHTLTQWMCYPRCRRHLRLHGREGVP
jgi:hypothetical protein